MHSKENFGREKSEYNHVVSTQRANAKEQIMKKQKGKPEGNEIDQVSEMRGHYEFDYAKATPNRFAESIAQDSIMVVLDPDVAAVFSTPESVNETLRAIASAIKHLPQTKSI